MRKTEEDISRLLADYLTGRLDESRRQQVEAWLEEDEEHRLFFEQVCRDRSLTERWQLRQQISTEAAIRRFDQRTGGGRTKTIRRWAYAGIAAGILLIAGTSLLLLRRQAVVEPPVLAQTEILPGDAKALLIFSNGSQMRLEAGDSLSVSLGEGAQVKNENQQLVYQGQTTDSLQYNELQIPRGGEYQVVLADGTVVRLNSGSSLKYPVVFSAGKREVELTGEAFFKVNKQAAPFLVKTGEMTVKVYGTAFNINTHVPGRIQTALVEGKVGITVRGDRDEYLLRPSQLADFDVEKRRIRIATIDLEPYVAWTKGMFVFYNETLQQILSTLSRWYDMEVFYQNPSLQELHFTGSIKRYDQIDTILKAISRSVGVKFRKEGKTLTVSY